MTARINQYMRLQGRKYALELVESLGEQLYTPKGVANAITRLTAAMQNKPESHVVGIRDIVEVLQKTLTASAHQVSADGCANCAKPTQGVISPSSNCATSFKEEHYE